jgi:CDP-paratose 2-epimerase
MMAIPNSTRHENRGAESGPVESGPVLITGGCGFVGTSLAHRMLSAGRRVRVFDDLSRRGVEDNLRWLQSRHGENLEVETGDVCDLNALRSSVREASSVFHFAAQVAVTTSVTDPLRDFEVNARGTLNVLEAVREASLNKPAPPLIFTSTNKVYGALDDLEIVRIGERYEPRDEAVRAHGIAESRALDFHSPYGCSKGAADQYVLDYARTFGLPALVFRMSCIYGPHQKGNEDQGWVAHFLLRALDGEPVTLYGDGRQVRDLLFSEDLVDAFLLAESNAERLRARAFNIGGGARNTFSLLELLNYIGELRGQQPDVRFDDWRPGDQRYYVSDARGFEAATGWQAKTNVHDGVRRLLRWLEDERASKNGAHANNSNGAAASREAVTA